MPGDITSRILDTIKTFGKKRIRRRQLYNLIGKKEMDYEEFKRILTAMEEEGQIVRMKGRRFELPEDSNLFTGVFTLARNGGGYIRSKDGESVYVHPRGVGGAVTGDLVQGKKSKGRPGYGPTASIVAIIERSAEPVVGIYRKTGASAYVIPRDETSHVNFIVGNAEDVDAEDGYLVVVKVSPHRKGFTLPVCTVVEVLGHPDDPGVDVLAVAKRHGLTVTFPEEVIAAVESLPEVITAEDLEGRTDLRDTVIFTIDPVDAKDFDDAVSIAKDKNGTFRIGVHIADVAHYVRDGSPVDVEAGMRGMSCYLVDRVIPMLPERLSNNLCSLRPDEDRLTKSVFATIDRHGQVIESHIANTVIHSRMRLTYEQVQAYLDGDGAHGADLVTPEVGAALKTLSELTGVLVSRRHERGALDFENPEARIVLDERGKPVDIVAREQLMAHRMIEEAMILANVITARALTVREAPFLYRIHEEPDPARFEAFAETAEALGRKFKASLALERGYVQAFLESLKGTDSERTLNMLLLRSMKRAGYSPVNKGHYGLALGTYGHFTSPIRRYPDLILHRQLDTYILRGDGAGETHDFSYYETLGDAVSDREIVTDTAERESIKMKAAEFMHDKLGEEYDGTVTGIMPIGFFVGLDRYFVEGLVHVSTLVNDYYTIDKAGVSLVGRATGQRFMLGDRVRVIVTAADKDRGEIDFMVVQELKKRTSRSGQKTSGRGKRKRRS